MVQLRFKPRAEQQALLAASTTRTAPIATTRRPLPLGTPARATDVLFALRAEDVSHAELAAARARLLLPLRTPGVALAELLRWSEHVTASRDAACRAAFDEDRRRREASMAAAWVDDAAGAVLAENTAAVLDAVAAWPELRHNTALFQRLAAIAATLKGSVA